MLSIHVTMLPGNENLVGREQLAMMKPGAILINTSRGEVLDAAALADAIKAEHLAGAAHGCLLARTTGGGFSAAGIG